jgi:hypothetical protein
VLVGEEDRTDGLQTVLAAPSQVILTFVDFIR